MLFVKHLRTLHPPLPSCWILALIRSEQSFDRHMSSSRTNQALRSLANAGFQNPGVFPSFPSPSPLFHFLALVSFLARPKPRISFLALSLLRNSTETLATQANRTRAARLFDFEITRMISDQIALHSVQLPLFIWRRTSHNQVLATSL